MTSSPHYASDLEDSDPPNPHMTAEERLRDSALENGRGRPFSGSAGRMITVTVHSIEPPSIILTRARSRPIFRVADQARPRGFSVR
jgi:hypothetical protein